MKSKILAHTSILGANIIYGVNYSVAKSIMPDYVKPLGLTFLRVIGAILLFWLISFFYKNEKIASKDLFRLLLCGFFGVAFNQIMFLKGLDFTTPIDASIIMTINPILVLIMASIIIKETVTFIKIIGIIIGGSGAVILISQSGDISFSSETFLGNIFMLINASSYAIYLVLVKPLMKKYKPITVMKWVFLFGFTIVGPFGFNEFYAIQWNELPGIILISIFFVVVFTTFFAYLLNIFGLKTLNPSIVATYIYSQPILASIVAVILKQDQIDWPKVLSAILVFTGVYLVSKTKKI